MYRSVGVTVVLYKRRQGPEVSHLLIVGANPEVEDVEVGVGGLPQVHGVIVRVNFAA